MNEHQKQLAERLKQAQNVLVTVSSNPSVDQLSAAIGLALALNKLDKHASAVYSGQTPSTLDFLKPDEILEGTTDSLRDFIIALDKSKADKLRYKVEDDVVRIFITPYRSSITEQDLEFSQGDFNVDVVVALGVQAQQDLDEAVQQHGRILHDATVATISNDQPSELGVINWTDDRASSLSELVARLVESFGKNTFDGQIATALLTGIVATTERFSNERTTPETMTMSATLMAAGANQQLIATELAAPLEQTEPMSREGDTETVDTEQTDPGTLEIDHNEENTEELSDENNAQTETSEPTPIDSGQESSQIAVDENGTLLEAVEPQIQSPKREFLGQDPRVGDKLSANLVAEGYDPPVEELTLPSMQPNALPLLRHDEMVINTEPEPTQADALVAAVQPPAGPQSVEAQQQSNGVTEIEEKPESIVDEVGGNLTFDPKEELKKEPFFTVPEAPAAPITEFAQPPSLPAADSKPADTFAPFLEERNTQPLPPPPPKTLADIEAEVASPHLTELEEPIPPSPEDTPLDLGEARHAVEAALSHSPPANPAPIEALNAQPLGDPLRTQENQFMNTSFAEPVPGTSPADQTLDMPLPSMQPSSGSAANTVEAPTSGVPPVPPPFIPPIR